MLGPKENPLAIKGVANLAMLKYPPVKPKVIHVVGARPQFIKAAVVCRKFAELGDSAPFEMSMVHTGQHYDKMLSETIFSELGIPEPMYNLGVGSGETYSQIAKIIAELGPVLQKEQPAAVLIYGDTDTTIAAAIAVHKLAIPLVHLEAGVRVYRRDEQVEESNRVISDHCAALCLVCTERAYYNLRREGLTPARISLVGDPMYDLFLWALEQLPRLATVSPAQFGLKAGEYYLSTIHRNENTTSDELLVSILEGLDSASLPVLLPLHPRVRVILDRIKWEPKGSLVLSEPLGYFDLITMLTQCKRVATDSGGVIREAFFAGIPSVVPRITNYWTEIIEAGWTTGADSGEELAAKLESFNPTNERPLGMFGDGNAGAKIVEEISKFVCQPRRDGPWHAHGFAADLPPATETCMTYENYQQLLTKLIEGGYQFANFTEAQALLEASKPFVLMRHDIDLSLPKALSLARLENELGVSSTFFLMVRTMHYNLFSREGTETVNEFLALGHHLGLHFDCASYPGKHSVEELAAACNHEVTLLHDWFQHRIDVVSYHRPNKTVLSGNPALSGKVPHTYMPLFTKDISYFADSRGEWLHGHPLHSAEFKQGKPLHLLIHPIWWNENPVSPYENMLRFAQQHFDALEQSMAQNCIVYRSGSLVGEEPEWIK